MDVDKKSPVWIHFKRDKKHGVAKCKKCDSILKVGSNSRINWDVLCFREILLKHLLIPCKQEFPVWVALSSPQQKYEKMVILVWTGRVPKSLQNFKLIIELPAHFNSNRIRSFRKIKRPKTDHSTHSLTHFHSQLVLREVGSENVERL